MPGPSFCWGPALKGPRSPSSSCSSTPGQAGQDRCGCAARAPPPPPRAHPIYPTHPTHGSRTFPPLCTAHAPRCTLRLHLTPFCPRVRRSSILPSYLDQGRGWRADAARRRRRGPCGPGRRLGARMGGGGGSLGVRRGSSKAGRLAHKKIDGYSGRIFFLCDLWTNPMM